MSNLLSQASLVMIPSGYKEDVVYSPIPTTGAGDLSFTRASNGTRVNSAGLVEVVPWNMQTYSEDFTNGKYTLNQASISSNATTAPNGTATADKLVENTANDQHFVYFTAQQTAYNETRISVYAKAGGRTNLLMWESAITNAQCLFNLSTGVVTSSSSGNAANLSTTVGQIEDAGNGWYRCSFNYSTSSGGGTIRLQLYTNTTSYTGDGTSGIFIWGLQENIGSTAKPYFPTTDRLNVPRLTYQNGGGGCPSLLLEKQSTNLCTYSQDFSNAAWNVSADSGCSLAITPNYTTASNGLPATRLVASRTNTSTLALLVNYAPNTSTSSTKSIWMKNNNAGNVTIMFGDEAVTITDSWERYSVTNTYLYSIVGLRYSGVALTCDISITGSQFELGSYPTSYIPTTSSSATRVADACFKTGISSLIGGGVGTWFMDFEFIEDTISNYTFAFNLSDGTITNHLYLYYNNPSWYWGGVDTAITLPSTLRKKVAIKYSSGTGKLFCNGSLISTLSISSSFSRLDIGNRFSQNYPMDGKINQAYFLTTSLTDAECQAITTI